MSSPGMVSRKSKFRSNVVNFFFTYKSYTLSKDLTFSATLVYSYANCSKKRKNLDGCYVFLGHASYRAPAAPKFVSQTAENLSPKSRRVVGKKKTIIEGIIIAMSVRT